MYSAMKKLLLIYIAGLLAAFPLFAEEKKEVSLRFSQHDGIMRVVLESDDNFIRSSNIIATLSNAKIEFPGLFELKKPKDFIFETYVKDRFLSITLKNAEDVKTYKLSSPARLVLDIRISQKLPNNLQVQAANKPQQESVKHVEKTVAARVIFLDSGHGGYDFGMLSKDTKEKDLNLLLTKDLSAALSKKGDKVFLTRKADQSISMLDRIIIGNSKKPDIFISLHSSASNAYRVYTAAFDESATEASVKLYRLSARQSRHIEKSRGLAMAIGQSLKDEFERDVFVQEMPLPILNSMDAGAVLIEYPSLRLNTYDQKMRERFVNAVVKGIGPHD